MSRDGTDGPNRRDGESDRGTGDRVTDGLLDDPSTRASLLGDLYRAEVDRATAWRSRLDQTTNWAVVLVAAILTWSFSSPDNPHYVLLIAMFGVVAFLLIEAHRYQEYDIWRDRVRLLQRYVFAPLFTRDTAGESDWERELGDSLDAPTISIPFHEAVGHRLRRIYLALQTILLAAWVLRITVFDAKQPWHQSAAVPGIDGEIIVILVAGTYLAMLGLAVWSVRQSSVGEIDP